MKKVFIFLFLVVITASGCNQSEKKEETKTPASQEDTASKQQESQTDQGEKKIVARVNGTPIYEKDLLGRSVRAAVTDEIMYQEGLKQGLDKKFDTDVESYKKRLVVEAVKKEILRGLPKRTEVSDEEIDAYYKKHKGQYQFLSLQEISVGDKGAAEAILKKLIAGEKPDKIVSEYSGQVKPVTLQELRFNRKYNNLFDKKEAGSISRIVQEKDQFKIFKIVEVKEIPLAKAKSAIKFNIMAKRRRKALRESIENLREKNDIKVEILAGKDKQEENETD